MTAPTVRRVVPNLHADDPAASVPLFELLGLRTVMDNEWILTLASPTTRSLQLSLLSADPSGLHPDVSIEVDDVDAVHAQVAAAGHDVVYPLSHEPWGVRRFVRSPDGAIINVLSHR